MASSRLRFLRPVSEFLPMREAPTPMIESPR